MEQAKKALREFGLPRIIIMAFFVVLIMLAAAYGMDIMSLLGDVIRRWGMYGIMVLAMVPGIQCGIGPNFGVTIGIVGGLLGSLIVIEMRFYGLFDALAGNPTLDAMVSVMTAIALSVVFSGLFGVLYGILLNQVKGSEMTVSTYVGFSIVAFFNIMWLILPFRSGTTIWPVGGEGARNTVSLEADFSGVFNNFLRFTLGGRQNIDPQTGETSLSGGLSVPTGMLIFFFLCCLVIWLFTKSRTGTMMRAAGANPKFAKASGINVNRMRVLGTTVSTVLGGVGIICYAQSFGFLQLYNAPQMMGFSCVASVLIGGASIGKARIFNVLLGAFLFHGILAVALPVANAILPEGNLSEILRIIISNGIILYALSKAKGAGK